MRRSGSGTGWVSVPTFMVGNRNTVPTGANSAGPNGYLPAFRLSGNRIVFQMPSSGAFRLIYTPQIRPLVYDTDEVDGVSGWTDLIVIDTAMKAKMKRDDPVQELMMRKAQIVDRIQKMAMNRDSGQPKRVTDRLLDKAMASFPYGGF